MSTRRTRRVLHGCGHFIPLSGRTLSTRLRGQLKKERCLNHKHTGKNWKNMTHQPFTGVFMTRLRLLCCTMSWASSKIQALQLCKWKPFAWKRGHNAVFFKTLNAESGPCHNRRACLNMCCSRYGNKGITKATHWTGQPKSGLDYWKRTDRFTLISPFLSNMSHNSMSGHTKICRKRRLKKPMSCQWLVKKSLLNRADTFLKKTSALDLFQSVSLWVCESAFFKLPSVQACTLSERCQNSHLLILPNDIRWLRRPGDANGGAWQRGRFGRDAIWWNNSNGILWIEHPWESGHSKRVAMRGFPFRF